MQKELNPELFGEFSLEPRSSKPLSSLQASGGSDYFQPQISGIGFDTQFLNVDQQIFELKGEVTKLTEKTKEITQTQSENTKNQQIKIERLAQSISRLEHLHNGFIQEASQKMAHLNGKLNERRTLDQKMQEMIDRHNNVLKSYEVRLNQLQKLLNEKESQIMSMQSTINEAKMEISRLKRL